MKNLFILIALLFSTASYSNIYSQVAPPPGAGDKDLRDTDVKRRSVEMDRIERDAKKTGKTPVSVAEAKIEEDRLAAKYGEIKTDYEQIQLSQDTVIKTYQGSGKIDYTQISKSALEINESAVRLKSNLFTAAVEISDAKKEVKKEEKKVEKTETETKPAKSVRDLIVDLDNTIGSFVASPMFQNLRTVDDAVSAKTGLDLEKIIELSAVLGAEARKMAAGGK
jgi:uncharacterized protein YukE